MSCVAPLSSIYFSNKILLLFILKAENDKKITQASAAAVAATGNEM